MITRLALGLLVLPIILTITEQAVHNHRPSGEKEKAEDGAYSPRDHHHGEGEDHDNAFDHEAILGSKKEAEEFDKLKPEEAKKRLTILLEKMDRNQDGSIDKKELYSWILRSFRSISKEESNERFKESDINGDGVVTWEEYKKEEYGMDEGEGVPKDEDDSEMLEEDRYLFVAADVSKDDLLDSKEFLSFSHPEEDDAMNPHVLAQILKEKDKDNDGELSFQEYIGDRGKDKDKDWLVEEKERFDTDLDKNGDNSMNREEILAWIIPSNEEIAEDEVTHLFQGADEDANEILSFTEVLNNHDLFVGSEATDYGNQLHKLHKLDEL